MDMQNMMKAFAWSLECWMCDSEFEISDIQDIVTHECIQELTVYEVRQTLAVDKENMAFILFPEQHPDRIEELEKPDREKKETTE